MGNGNVRFYRIFAKIKETINKTRFGWNKSKNRSDEYKRQWQWQHSNSSSSNNDIGSKKTNNNRKSVSTQKARSSECQRSFLSSCRIFNETTTITIKFFYCYFCNTRDCLSLTYAADDAADDCDIWEFDVVIFHWKAHTHTHTCGDFELAYMCVWGRACFGFLLMPNYLLII